MILGFGDASTEDIFNGADTKDARKIPRDIWKAASRKLDMLNASRELRDLMAPPANRLEKLKGRLKDYHSIRVNNQFRVIFKWVEGNVSDVRITNYH